ncbi:MAG: hypothetical protein ACR2Q4_09170 [Geminicoccaceae bacterium]
MCAIHTHYYGFGEYFAFWAVGNVRRQLDAENRHPSLPGVVVMSLDLSGAEQLARDFFQMSSDYRAHDPELAAELASKAQEICRDFGIEVDVVSEETVVEPKLGLPDAATMAEHGGASDEAQTSDNAEVFDDQEQLMQILDHQKALVAAQANDQVAQTSEKERSTSSGWSMFSSLLRLETA